MSLATLAIACGDLDNNGAEPDLGETGPEATTTIATSGQGLWRQSSRAVYKSWYSGNTSRLSSWQQITCATTYGRDHLLVKLTGNEEARSTDNFLARLRGTCRRYRSTSRDNYEPQFSSDRTEEIFSANYDNRFVTISEIPLANGAVPVGVLIRHNAIDNYVKALSLVYELTNGVRVGPTNYTDTGWTPRYNGTTDLLECSGAGVLTGMAVRYSTNKGKIRQVRIYCRDLIHQ